MSRILYLAALAIALAAAAGRSDGASAGDQPQVSVTSAAARQGEQVTVVLAGDSGADTFAAFDLKVVYDPSVVAALDCTSGLGLCNAAFNESTVRVAGVSVAGWSGHVEFASVTLALVGPPGSETALDVQVVNLANADVADIAAETGVVDGNIQILSEGEPTPEPTPPPSPEPSPRQGDAQCDGDVDSVDALTVLRAVAGVDEPDCVEQADVNCDGQVSAVDALWVLRYVAGLPVDPPADCAPIDS